MKGGVKVAPQVAIPIMENWPRVTMFLSGPDTTIAESHWYFGPDDYTRAMAEAEVLAKARAKLLGTDCSILLSRVSMENIFRDSLVVDTSLMTPPTANGLADPRHRSLRYRMESTSLYRKTLYLGLVPDDTVVTSKYAENGVPGWNDAKNQYFSYLCGLKPYFAQWGFLVTDKDPGRCPVVRIIQIVNPFPGNLITFVTKDAHKLNPQDVVRIRNVGTKLGAIPSVNKLFKVNTVPTPLSFTVNMAPGPGAQNPVRGTAQKKQRIFAAYSNFFSRDVGFRKRGNRAFLPLGKQRTQK